MPDVATIHTFLAEHHRELAQDVRAFAEAEIAPLPPAHDDDDARRQAKEILARLGAGGWIRHAVPEAYGGSPHGPDLSACCLIRETLASVSPLADSVFALQCLGSMPLTLAGSEKLRAAVLPEAASGRKMAAFAMTEPEAGTDAAAIATRARRDGAGWRLDGGKHLITNAGIADFYVVFAATDPEAGRRGLSCFLVESDRPGLEFAGPQVLSEPHPLGKIAFDGCRVPGDHLVGAAGEGFKIAMRTLDRLRATVAAAACGMAERALAEGLEHARERRQFGRPLAEQQLIQQKLARMATELAASRLLTYRAAREADAGAERVTLVSAMAKSYATEAAQRIVDDAVQILGGRGVLRDHPVDRLYRAVRALRIYEGTTEIQHVVIARQLLAP